MIERAAGAEQAMANSMKLAIDAGVTVGSGSDLLGPQQNRRGLELVLHAGVVGAMEAIVQATSTNAKIIRRDDDLGHGRGGQARRPHRGGRRPAHRARALRRPVPREARREGRTHREGHARLTLAQRIASAVRPVADFPVPGFPFRDVTPLLEEDPQLFHDVIDAFVEAITADRRT